MLFDAETAERYNLINRIVAPEQLDDEVEALCRVMLEKNPVTVRRTKFIMNRGADLHVSGSLAFEVPLMPFDVASEGKGLQDFADREARAKRYELSRTFWQD
jgi:enoyl-CoA hydratase/carnithine racemase